MIALSYSLPITAQDDGIKLNNLAEISIDNVGQLSIQFFWEVDFPVHDVKIHQFRDGYLIAAADHGIHLWYLTDDATSYSELDSQIDFAQSILFNMPRHELFVLHENSIGTAIEVFDVNTETSIQVLNISEITSMDISIDGRLAVGREDGSACLVDISEEALGECFIIDNDGYWATYGIAFSSIENVLAVSNLNGVRLWDIATGSILQNYGRGYNVVISLNGQYMAYQDPFGAVFLVGLQTREPIIYEEQPREIGIIQEDMLLTPDGSMIALINSNGDIYIYNTLTGENLTILSNDNLSTDTNNVSIDISPDGKLIAYGDSEGNIILWGVPQESTP